MLVAGETKEVTLQLTEPPAWSGVPIWVPVTTGVIAGVGLGIGVVAEVLRADARTDFDATAARLGDTDFVCHSAGAAADCSALEDAAGRHNTARSVEIAGFVIGGAAAAATLGLVLFGRGTGAEEHGADIRPMLGPGLGGLVVTGTF